MGEERKAIRRGGVEGPSALVWLKSVGGFSTLGLVGE